MDEPTLPPPPPPPRSLAPDTDPVEALAAKLRELRDLPPLHPRAVRDAAVKVAELALEEVRCKIKIVGTRIPPQIVEMALALRDAAGEKMARDVADNLRLPRDRVTCDPEIRGDKTDRVVVRFAGAEPQTLRFDGSGWEPEDYGTFALAAFTCRSAIHEETRSHLRRAVQMFVGLLLLAVTGAVAIGASMLYEWTLAACFASAIVGGVGVRLIAAQADAESRARALAPYLELSTEDRMLVDFAKSSKVRDAKKSDAPSGGGE